MLAALAENQINIALLTRSHSRAGSSLSFCISNQQTGAVQDLLNTHSSPLATIVSRAPVGILSLYPHRARFDLIATIILTLGEAGIVSYATATSISALSLVIDESQLDPAATALQRVVALPANHSPMRQLVSVRQLER